MKLETTLGVAALAAALTVGCHTPPKDDKKAEPAGGSAPAASGAPAYDMRGSMQAPSPLPLWTKDGAGMKQGWWIEQKLTAGGNTTVTKYAIVGVAGDMVKIEKQGPDTMGFIEGLTAKMADGTLVAAGAAKKGEKAKDIKIAPTPAPAAAAAPAATDEDVAVKAGTFKAKKVVNHGMVGDTTTWSGVDGDVANVLLKSQQADATYELQAVSLEDWKCGDKVYKVKHLTYTNGQEMWLLPEPLPFVGNVAKMKSPTYSMEITNIGEGAAPEIDWGK